MKSRILLAATAQRWFYCVSMASAQGLERGAQADSEIVTVF